MPNGFERTRRLLRLPPALRLDGGRDAVGSRPSGLFFFKKAVTSAATVFAIDRVYKPNRRSRYNHTMKMESSEVFDSLEGHLKTTDEMDLVVLRGHLILEQCLNALLTHWITPDRLPKLNLTFAKKVDLYEALQKPGQHWAEEIAHLRELNRIRNKLAHQLPSKPGHHADVKKWACSVVGYTPKTINRRVTYRRIVLKAFYLLTGYLSGTASMADVVKAENKKRGLLQV